MGFGIFTVLYGLAFQGEVWLDVLIPGGNQDLGVYQTLAYMPTNDLLRTKVGKYPRKSIRWAVLSDTGDSCEFWGHCCVRGRCAVCSTTPESWDEVLPERGAGLSQTGQHSTTAETKQSFTSSSQMELRFLDLWGEYKNADFIDCIRLQRLPRARSFKQWSCKFPRVVSYRATYNVQQWHGPLYLGG
ncbi:hypothetical protein B0H66DRAFT_220410 [Apodospora peruviana]|uniref:Uncharacterized protein n=1 Tax=Apodospora peruviana TaxID=516989 RepID=A0AAE0I406_9PEZI|nr:hypothetical protein B0H66DRAFT_220410 [Apodospora peruviana]